MPHLWEVLPEMHTVLLDQWDSLVHLATRGDYDSLMTFRFWTFELQAAER